MEGDDLHEHVRVAEGGLVLSDLEIGLAVDLDHEVERVELHALHVLALSFHPHVAVAELGGLVAGSMSARDTNS